MTGRLTRLPESDELTVTQADRLADCEQRVRSGLQTFVEVGQALAEIRDGRLYRQTHTTFEAYCETEFGLTRQRAYQLIDSAATVEAMSTIVDTPAPRTESQARELAGLPAETAAEVMRTAVQSSDKVTATTIRAARNVIAPRPEPTATAEQVFVHPQTGEVFDEIPDGYTDVNPAAVAAEARRDYMTSPWPVFSLKLLGDLKRWGDWLALPAVGGPTGVLTSLNGSGLPGTDDDAQRALDQLDAAVVWIDALRVALRESAAPKLRSVK